MDDRKKILLGEKDIITRQNENFNIDINLTQSHREIIPYKFDNNFDLKKQYNIERNSCRNFRIYGTIESPFIDCDALFIHIFNKKPIIEDAIMSNNDGYIKSIAVTPVTSELFNTSNIFNKKKGKYLIELDKYEYDKVFFFISGLESDNYQNVYERQLVYRYETLNSLGENTLKLVPYGTENTVVDINGNILPVSNNFNFFYDKHWIKEDIKLTYKRLTHWVPFDPICISQPAEIEWHQDETSMECLTTIHNYTSDTGVSSMIVLTNGMKRYSRLIQSFSNTLTPILDADIKDNVSTDVDYVPDSLDTVRCVNMSTTRTLTIVNDVNVYGYAQGTGFTTQIPNIANTVSPYNFMETVIISATPNYNSVFLGFEEYTYDNIGAHYFTTNFQSFSGASMPIVMDENKIYRAKFAESVIVTIKNARFKMKFSVPNPDDPTSPIFSGILTLGNGLDITKFKFPKGSFIGIAFNEEAPTSNTVYYKTDSQIQYENKHFIPQPTPNVIDNSYILANFELTENLTLTYY